MQLPLLVHWTTQEAVPPAHMLEHPYVPLGNVKKSPPTAPQLRLMSFAEWLPSWILKAQASPARPPHIMSAMMRMMDLRIETSHGARHIQHAQLYSACRLCRAHANITGVYGSDSDRYRRIE